MEKLIVIAACLVLNSLLAAYEVAFISTPKPELRRLAREGNREAKNALNLRMNPERTLSVIQVGITLVGALSAAVGGAGASETIEPYLQQHFEMSASTSAFWSIAGVVVPLTYLTVVMGELVPKSLALRNSVRITLFGARWLSITDRILTPVVTLLEWSTKQILRTLFRRVKSPIPPPETTVEIDALSPHHQEAILNLAHIERQKIKDILVPWKDVTRVQSTETMDDVVPLIFASGHTRLPVIENGNVIGILHTKEFLAYRESGKRDWKSILRPPLKVTLNDSVLSTLRLMQTTRSHMAIVTSLESSPLGMVTLEEISAEIWGDLFDEDEDSRIRQIFAERVKLKWR